jgi:riboflavin kinase, archaea type
MSLKGYRNQFKEKLGYEPFPGTLNLKLEDKIYMDKKKEITNYPSIYIHGFKDENRTFGWVKCYPAILTLEMEKYNKNLNKGINTKDNKAIKLDSAILLLERTHHDNSLMEIISPYCIKETANLKNGDIVTIELKDLK